MGSQADHAIESLPGPGSIQDKLLRFFGGGEIGPGIVALDYAENITNVGTTIAGTTGVAGTWVDIPNCSIVVPATNAEVCLKGACKGAQTVAGLGAAGLRILDITGGGSVDVEWALQYLPNSTSVRGRDFTLIVEARVGILAVEKTYKLQAKCDSVAANTPSWSVYNLAALRSFLKAWAEV